MMLPEGVAKTPQRRNICGPPQGPHAVGFVPGRSRRSSEKPRHAGEAFERTTARGVGGMQGPKPRVPAAVGLNTRHKPAEPTMFLRPRVTPLTAPSGDAISSHTGDHKR